MFLLAIPIILRLVRSGSTLTDILAQQLPITKLDICIIQHALKQKSSQILLVMDGYDEIQYQGTGIIQKVMRREECKNATVIVTTRHHGLPLIYSLGYGVIQLQAEIIGFDKKQIKGYIEKFMLANKEKSQNKLFRYLVNNEALWKLAKSPSQLEIICFVWISTSGELGERLYDLYEEFLISLLKHMERKKNPFQPEYSKQVSNKMMLENNLTFLKNISKMANQWDGNGNIQAVFQHDELELHLNSDLDRAKQLGCIVKYNPSKNEESSDWCFTHLTLQYFFVAFFLSHSKEEDARDFAKHCSPIAHFDTVWGIVKFLCAMNTSVANTVLQTYAKMTTGKLECMQLQTLFCQAVQEYKSSADVNIPLPEFVEWTREQDAESLKVLSHSDEANDHRNMRYLEVKRVQNEFKNIDMSYVPNISLTLRNQEEIKVISESVSRPSKAQNISLTFLRQNTTDEEVKSLLQIFPQRINTLSVDGYNILQPISKAISLFDGVGSLHLKDKIASTVDVDYPWTSVIPSFPNVASISVEQSVLDKSFFFSLDFQGTLQLHFYGKEQVDFEEGKEQVDFEEMRQTLDEMTKCCCNMRLLYHPNNLSNIKYLNLSGKSKSHKDLTAYGDVIGMLLVKSPNMELLKLNYCKLNFSSLRNMARKIVKHKKYFGLKSLSMAGNDLQGGLGDLSIILQRTPELTELELFDSQLGNADFDQLFIEKSLIPKLHHLNVRGNIFEKRSSCFHYILSSKSQLNFLNMGWCNIDAHIIGSTDFKNQSLQQLDLRYNPLGDDGLRFLASSMHKMPSLRILNLSSCGFSDAGNLVLLCGSIPPSLEELDVRSNPFDAGIVKVNILLSWF